MWDTLYWRKVYLDPDDDLWDEPLDDDEEDDDVDGLRLRTMTPFFIFCSRRAARAWRRALSSGFYRLYKSCHRKNTNFHEFSILSDWTDNFSYIF